MYNYINLIMKYHKLQILQYNIRLALRCLNPKEMLKYLRESKTSVELSNEDLITYVLIITRSIQIINYSNWQNNNAMQL